MSKYDKLGEHLDQQVASPITMTFGQVESVLGFPLPASAYKNPGGWWSNTKGMPHSNVWLTRGWRSERINGDAQQVTFRRTGAGAAVGDDSYGNAAAVAGAGAGDSGGVRDDGGVRYGRRDNYGNGINQSSSTRKPISPRLAGKAAFVRGEVSNYSARVNHERVGKSLKLLQDGLGPFVDRAIKAAGKTGKIDPDTLWSHAGNQVQSGQPIRGWDVAALLRIMWGLWNDVFGAVLDRPARSLVSELRDFRNKWAHQTIFSNDDAYRVLDSAARLLVAVSAADQFEEVELLKDEILRERYETRARRKSAEPAPPEAATPAKTIPAVEALPVPEAVKQALRAAGIAPDLIKPAKRAAPDPAPVKQPKRAAPDPTPTAAEPAQRAASAPAPTPKKPLQKASQYYVRGSKYDALGKHLDKQGISPVTMTFKEVEEVLGFPLPGSALKHPVWWSNSEKLTQAKAWVARGWRTKNLDQAGGRVVFHRADAADAAAGADAQRRPQRGKGINKYDSLGEHLNKQSASWVAMTFSEIEEVLGFALPDSAAKHPGWWSNSVKLGQGKSWVSRGWRTKEVDQAARQVLFSRAETDSDRRRSGPAQRRRLSKKRMNKYDGLGMHLAKQQASSVAMTFSEIEAVLGFALPDSAVKHPGWWSNTDRLGQGKAWISRGWRVKNVDQAARQALFCRAEAATTVAPAPPNAAPPSNRRVNKYDGLGKHLEKQQDSSVAMTFGEIEAVLGFPLPDSAAKHPGWWANSVKLGQGKAWVSRGWRVENADQAGRQVVFRRAEADDDRRRSPAKRRRRSKKRANKYDVLGKHLDKQMDSSVTMTFGEIEAVLGFSLPDSAAKHPGWWANSEKTSQGKSWTARGWRTEGADQAGRKVAFRLVDNSRRRKRANKYDKLGEHLDKQTTGWVTLRFSQIEEILGMPLPKSAYQHSSWWANGTNHGQGRVWVSRGWRTESADPSGRQVTFRRLGSSRL